MKVFTDVTIYKCDFCPKKLFKKSAMIAHEQKCKSNPANIRGCFNCIHCDKVPIKYDPGYNYDLLIESHSFKCNAKENVFMFPPKLEHSKNGVPEYVIYEEEEITQRKMPIKCDLQEPPLGF